MAIANNNGWDFIKVGKTYQYKEDSFIALVEVLEDNSTDEEYKFKLLVKESNERPIDDNGIFLVYNKKKLTGYYSGMINFYENTEYYCEYMWINENGVIKMKDLNYRTPGRKGVKLFKIKELEDAVVPNNIEQGFVVEGDFLGEPEVGDRFYVSITFSTSPVKEILSKNTFKTYNSIYQWEILEPIEEK